MCLMDWSKVAVMELAFKHSLMSYIILYQSQNSYKTHIKVLLTFICIIKRSFSHNIAIS